MTEAAPAAAADAPAAAAATLAAAAPAPAPAAGDAAAPAAPAAAPAAAAPPAIRADGKPGWLPEKFKSEEELHNSYKELERVQFSRKDALKAEVKGELEAERLKGVPAAPGDYASEPFKAPNGQEVKLNEDDPITKWFRSAAHELKLNQGQFQKLTSEFLNFDMQRGPKWEDEGKKLGEAADLRLGRVEGWMKGNAPQSVYDTFAGMPARADLVQMFEHIMTLAGEPAFTPSETPSGFIETVTKESLQAMQKDPKYWRDKDPAFVRQVSAGFRKLAKG